MQSDFSSKVKQTYSSLNLMDIANGLQFFCTIVLFVMAYIIYPSQKYHNIITELLDGVILLLASRLLYVVCKKIIRRIQRINYGK